MGVPRAACFAVPVGGKIRGLEAPAGLDQSGIRWPIEDPPAEVGRPRPRRPAALESAESVTTVGVETRSAAQVQPLDTVLGEMSKGEVEDRERGPDGIPGLAVSAEVVVGRAARRVPDVHADDSTTALRPEEHDPR